MYCKASGSARDWEKGSQDSTIIIVEEKADAWMLGEFGLVMRMTTGDGRPFVWSRGFRLWFSVAVWLPTVEAGDAKETCHDIIPEGLFLGFGWLAAGWRGGGTLGRWRGGT